MKDEYKATFEGHEVFVTIDADDYDPRFSNNGGSYYQPGYRCSAEGFGELFIDDSSCGDFGTRIFAEVTENKKKIGAYYGSMLDEEQEFSDFGDTETEAFWLRFASEVLGYHIPTADCFRG